MTPASLQHILIVSGEASGDLHAAELCRNLRVRAPGLKISAVGGDCLRSTGAAIIADIKDFSVMGLFDALKKLPSFFKLKDRLLAFIAKEKPDALILVDFSGFNLRLARAVNHAIPVIYYISPQVWASRAGRVKTIKDCVDTMIVFFPFEKKWYSERGMDVELVGHPLLDIVKPSQDRGSFLSSRSLNASQQVVTLLPGSRKQEIALILPVMLKACRLLKNEIPALQFIIARPAHLPEAFYLEFCEKSGVNVTIVEAKAYDCVNAADLCLVASGTATLETAILQKPLLVIYRMSALNYWLYRPQVKIPHISLVNIVAGKKIVPEFIQDAATPEAISTEALRILQSPQETERIKQELSRLVSSLGAPGAAARAAASILQFLE